MPRLTRLPLRGAVIGMALALSACSSTPLASTDQTSSSAPSASIAAEHPSPPASRPVYDGEVGAIVFNRHLHLYTIGADGSHEQLIHASWDGIGLSRDGTAFFSPANAPDGRLLPLILPADGSSEYWLPVADPNVQLGIGDWSPDGTRLIFDAWDDTDASRHGIYSLSLDGTDLVRLTDPGPRHDWPAYAGAYSPDGDRVLFFRPVAEEMGDAGSMNLFVVNADRTGLVQLNPSDTQAGLVGPSGASDWSPDGQQVAFVASEGDFWSADPRAVFVVNADGSDPVRVTEWGDILTVQWSPDGQRLAMTAAGTNGRYEIVTLRRDGSDLMTVTSSANGTFSFGAMWSPDGSQLLFIRGTDLRGSMDLWIVNADGTSPLAVTASSGEVGGYEWVPRPQEAEGYSLTGPAPTFMIRFLEDENTAATGMVMGSAAASSIGNWEPWLSCPDASCATPFVRVVRSVLCVDTMKWLSSFHDPWNDRMSMVITAGSDCLGDSALNPRYGEPQ